jgi:hypothetical protein
MGLTTGLVARPFPMEMRIGPERSTPLRPLTGARPGASTRDERAVAALLTRCGGDVLMNATDPRFVTPPFRAVLSADVHYLDPATSLNFFEISRLRHPAWPARTSLVTVFQR